MKSDDSNGMTPKRRAIIGVTRSRSNRRAKCFADPFIIEWVDKGQDEHEQRLSAIGMVENRLLFVAYTMRGDTIRVISARRADRLNDGGIMKRIKHDWKEADALTDAEIHAAALADPDAATADSRAVGQDRRVPRAQIIATRARLSPGRNFATRYHIP